MSDSRADIAVFGSTPLARLLAGLLASLHGKSVVWIGDSHAAFRLPRGIDLSVGPITRPQTWAVLAQNISETLKVLARAGGKTALLRFDPIFFADSACGHQALAFLRSSAAGLGQTIDRLPADHLGTGRDGLVLRDAIYLHRDRLEPILDTWLGKLGVRRFSPTHANIGIGNDGSALIAHESERIEAAQAILADDESILAHLPAEALDALFDRQTMTTILTEPTLPMASRLMLQVDGDLSLVQAKHGGVIATGAGSYDHCVGQIGVLLGADRHLRQAGGIQYDSLRSRDGAPVFGQPGASGAVIIAGLGHTGTFLAPALARWLAGMARPDDTDYVTAHTPGRNMSRSSVAEYLPAPVAA